MIKDEIDPRIQEWADMLVNYSLGTQFKEKYQGIIKDHEILWLIKKHKSEPYPDVSRVYGGK